METKLGTRVISYYTPKDSSINQNHPDIFLEQLRHFENSDALSLIIVSNGGDSSASLRIAHILRDYCARLNIVVPSRCASAATVLALSGDKIIMSPSGFLTAIDTSLVHGLNPRGPDNRPVAISVDQVKRILKFLNEEGPAVTDSAKEGSYRTLFKYIHPVAIGEIDRISSRTILVATKMMQMHPQSFRDSDQITWIANHLYNDYPEHGFPILYQEARDIGLPVEKADRELAGLLRDLVNLYDSATTPVTTHFDQMHYHQTGFTNLVETVTRRTVFRNSYNRRLNPTTKTWQTENDFSQWVNVSPPVKPGDGVSIRPLDLPLTSSETIEPTPRPA